MSDLMPVVLVEGAGEQTRAFDFSQPEGATEPSIFTRFAHHPTLPKICGIHYTPFRHPNDERSAVRLQRFSNEKLLRLPIGNQRA